MVEKPNLYDDLNSGDYGVIPPDAESLPGVVQGGHIKNPEHLLNNPGRLKQIYPHVHGFITEVQEANKKVVVKIDAHKGTTLIFGTAVTIGAAGAVVAVRRYGGCHK